MSDEGDESDDISMIQLKLAASKVVTVKKEPEKIKIPRRAPSIVVPEPKVIVWTSSIKPKPKKLRQCQISPPTLYELCAAVIDNFQFPEQFDWSVEQVADWMDNVVGLPQYRECIIDNHINGRRLLFLEDPSVLPEINIHYLYHIKVITAEIRKVFKTDFIRFARSIGLPIRKPLTHCTWFKSRTGPSWGIRENWTRSDILRWMKIVGPKPLHLDHWDLVWYLKPDFPKTMFARIPKAEKRDDIPHYVPIDDFCYEYLSPRRFRLQANIPEEAQFIWLEHPHGSPCRKEATKKEDKKVTKKKKKKESRLIPKIVSLTGLTGKDLILARRKMPKTKFLPKG